MRDIRADSTEYVTALIQSDHDIRGARIAFSLTPDGDWYTAESVPGGARLLVGPYGRVFLMKGIHTVYVRIEDGAEVPVFPVGRLNVT